MQFNKYKFNKDNIMVDEKSQTSSELKSDLLNLSHLPIYKVDVTTPITTQIYNNNISNVTIPTIPTRIYNTGMPKDVLKPGTLVKYKNKPFLIIEDLNDTSMYDYKIKQLIETDKIIPVLAQDLKPFDLPPQLWNGKDSLKENMIVDFKRSDDIWCVAKITNIVNQDEREIFISVYFSTTDKSYETIINIDNLHSIFAIYGTFTNINQSNDQYLYLLNLKIGDAVKYKNYDNNWVNGTIVNIFQFENQILYVHIWNQALTQSQWIENIETNIKINSNKNIEIKDKIDDKVEYEINSLKYQIDKKLGYQYQDVNKNMVLFLLVWIICVVFIGAYIYAIDIKTDRINNKYKMGIDQLQLKLNQVENQMVYNINVRLKEFFSTISKDPIYVFGGVICYIIGSFVSYCILR